VNRVWSTETLAALLLLLPLLAVPWAFKPYTANVLAVYMIYGILALSLTLIWGYAGIMSFGQTAFFGIGAYAYGAIGLNLINRTQQTHSALLGGLAAAAILAAIVGYFMFYGRISDVYASIITLALTLVLFAFAVSTGGDEWVIGVARFGGFNGMFGQGESSQNIANFQIPPVTVWLPGMAQPFEFKINRESAAGYFLVLGVSVFMYLVVRWLLRVRLGRVAVGIRENEARVASLGYDTRFYKFALVIIGYLTSYLAEFVPFASIPSDATPWVKFLMETGRRIVREAPLLVQGAVLVGIVLALEDGVTPPLSRLLTRYRRWAWWVLLPAVVFYFAQRVACMQADVCLF
jgi:ABC-type branched-subunit amino acid transport system permease subunit